MSWLQVVSYMAILFFMVFVAARIIRIARMPVHLRWDLYPIPHERGKSRYGGSYFEEVDWWAKPKAFSLPGEIKEMAKEIIFIQSVFHHNRVLWIFSFPFHIGMYCLIGMASFALLGAIINLAGGTVSVSAGGLGLLVHVLTIILGTIGWSLSAYGAIGLFLMRLGKHDLKQATVFSDFVNLLFLLAVFVTGIIAWFLVDPIYETMRGFLQSLISFSALPPLPQAIAVNLWITAALLFYFPFTHMTHMFGKYFTYHKVRWEDEPNTRGGHIEKTVSQYFGYRLNWSAPHIKAGSTWAEAAATTGEEKKDE